MIFSFVFFSYFYDNLDPRSGTVKFKFTEKVCTDIRKKLLKNHAFPKCTPVPQKHPKK